MLGVRRLIASSATYNVARCISSIPNARINLFNQVQQELMIENRNYKKSALIEQFTKNSDWNFIQIPNSTEMSITRDVGDIRVSVEFSYTSPDFEAAAGGDVETDFILSVTRISTNEGLKMFCCTTPKSESSAYAIGNVTYLKNVSSANESAYPGPDFEDLDTVLMDSFDKWLENLGVNADVCDFIVAASIDKDQTEFMKWLENIKKLTQA